MTKRTSKISLAIACAAVAFATGAQAQHARPVSPNSNWRANLNGGGTPTTVPRTQQGELLDRISNHPLMPSGNLEIDRRKAESFKRQMQIDNVQRQIEAERQRRAVPTAPPICELKTPATQPRTSVVEILRRDKEAMSQRLQESVRRGDQGPAMKTDTRPEWERQIWQRNQHILNSPHN